METFKKIFEMIIAPTKESKVARLSLVLTVWYATKNIEHASRMDLVMLISIISIVMFIMLKSLSFVNDKEWYFITEENLRTYIKKIRRQRGEMCVFCVVTIMLSTNGLAILEKLLGISKLVNMKLVAAVGLLLILVILYSVHTLVIYHIGWVVAIVFYIGKNANNSISGAILFLLFVFIFYLIVIKCIPFPIIRKLEKMDMILAFLITMILPIFLQLIFESQSDYIISLVVASYAISTLIVRVKSRIGINIAEYEYRNIITKQECRENITYEILRECVYYGGDEYKKKLMKNQQFRLYIENEEKENIENLLPNCFEKLSIKIKKMLTSDLVIKLLKKIV